MSPGGLARRGPAEVPAVESPGRGKEQRWWIVRCWLLRRSARPGRCLLGWMELGGVQPEASCQSNFAHALMNLLLLQLPTLAQQVEILLGHRVGRRSSTQQAHRAMGQQ